MAARRPWQTWVCYDGRGRWLLVDRAYASEGAARSRAQELMDDDNHYSLATVEVTGPDGVVAKWRRRGPDSKWAPQ